MRTPTEILCAKKYSKYEVHTDCELPISVAWHDGNTKLFSMRCRRDLIKRIRRQTVEHPFGTIKARMGATHFLTRTIERVSTEMSLHVLAYNMKRVIKLLGSDALMTAMRA